MNGTRRVTLLAVLILAVTAGNLAANMRLLAAGSSAEGAGPPVDMHTAPLSERIVLVVLDGVPVRVAEDPTRMPELAAMAAIGARGVLRAPEQTNTAAAVTALGTGAATQASDMLGLFYSSEFSGWTVFDDLIARDETVAFAGADVWSSLFASRDPKTALRPGASTWRPHTPADDVAEALARIETADPPALTVLHIGESDRLAHRHGTESEPYRQGIREIDAVVGRLRDRVMRPGTTMIVTSDHGVDFNGSHGGPADVYREVPLVMIGAGILPGAEARADAAAMPGIIATLLGTRLPAEMNGVIPTEVFDVDPATRAAIVRANARQIAAMANARGGELAREAAEVLTTVEVAPESGRSEDVVAASNEALPRLLDGIRTGTHLQPARLLWCVALLAVILIAGQHLDQRAFGGPALEAALLGAIVVAAFGPWLPISQILVASGALALLASVVVALVVRSQGARRSAVIVGAAAGLGLVAVAAVRFAYMPRIYELLASAPRVPALGMLCMLALGLLLIRHRLPIRLLAHDDVQLALTAAFVLALLVLQPISAAPVLMIAAVGIALLAAGRGRLLIAATMVALAGLFLVAHRIGFAWSGEVPAWRYGLALPTGALAALVLMKMARHRGACLGVALAPLVLAWPFGYLKIMSKSPDALSTAVAAAFVVGVAAVVAIRRRAGWLSLVPLATTGVYLIAPADAVFATSLATHGAVLLLGSLGTTPSRRRAGAMVVAMSGVALMTKPYDLPTVALLMVAMTAAGSLVDRRLPRGVVVLVLGVLVGFGRYAFVDLVTHDPNTGNGLHQLDLGAGYYWIGEESLAIATALVLIKTLFVAVLVFAAVLGNVSRRLEMPVATAAAVVSAGFLVQATLQTALSFGEFTPRLGDALSATAFHSLMLLATLLGLLLYRGSQSDPFARILARANAWRSESTRAENGIREQAAGC